MKKKKYIIFFLLVLVSSIFTPKVTTAYVNYINDTNKLIYLDEANNYTYIAMCSYAHKEDKKKAGNQGYYSNYERINIYYTYNDNWLVVWDKTDGFASDENNTIEQKGSAEKVFGDRVHISEDSKNQLLEQGICPQLGFVDTGGAYSEVCFGTEEYCASESGWMTQFASSTTNLIATSLSNYSIEEQIQIYFDNWYPEINSCEDLRNKTTNIQEILEQDFIDNFMKGKPIPGFIIDNQTYIEGMEELKNKYKSFKEDCDEEVKNNPNLSEEERNELLEQNEDGYQNAVEGVDNASESIEEKREEISENSEDTPPNYHIDSDVNVDSICAMPSYRKPMRFIGTIINFLKIIIPIVIIGFGIMDLYKAVTGSKDDEIKKAVKSIVIRAIAGIFIFLLPGIVQFILNWVNEWSHYENSWCCCTDCLLNPDCDVNSCNSNSCKIEGTN